jgi:hypothetical protein
MARDIPELAEEPVQKESCEGGSSTSVLHHPTITHACTASCHSSSCLPHRTYSLYNPNALPLLTLLTPTVSRGYGLAR